MAGSSTLTLSLTEDQKEIEKNQKLASHYLQEGKRYFLIKENTSAVTQLGEACRILSEIHGDLSEENAEAHFYYGKALLEQARDDATILENKPSAGGAEDDEEDDDDEEVEDENPIPQTSGDDNDTGKVTEEKKSDEEEGSSEDNEAEAAEKKEVDLNAPSPSEKAPADSAEQVPTSSSSSSAVNSRKMETIDNEQPSTSKGVKEGDGDVECEDDEPSTLELAWEVFEVAKIGYRKQIESIRAKLPKAADEGEKNNITILLNILLSKLAETYSLLGEVSTESENYKEAEEEYQTSLHIITTEVKDPDIREIAQIYFQLGVTLSLAKDYKGSIENFNKAARAIEDRIEILNEKFASGQVASEMEEKEIKELKEILPEVLEKVKDTIESENQMEIQEEEERQDRELIISKSPIKNPNLPAPQDISHLVKKKKRESDVEPQSNNDDEQPLTKKLCLGDESNNGNGLNGSSTNGV